MSIHTTNVSHLHYMRLCYVHRWQGLLVSSCQQLRHGSDIINMHVDLSMLDILFGR